MGDSLSYLDNLFLEINFRPTTMKHICINDITGEAKSTKAQSYTREHL